MIKCSKCNELLGDEITECPFCKHIISEEERRKIIEQKELMHKERVQNAMREYRRRLRNEIIIFLFCVGSITLGGLIIISLGLSVDIMINFSYIIFLLTLILSIICKTGCCPYCGSSLGKYSFFLTHCPKCKGRLR